MMRSGWMGMTRQGGKKVAGGSTSPRKRRSKGLTVSQAATRSWLDMAREEKYVDTRPLWGPVRDLEKGWKPTAMGDPCDRKTILGVLGYRGELISVKLRRIFDMGRYVELMWQATFTDLGLLLAHNVRVKNNGPIIIVSGEYDVLVRHPYDKDRRELGEIKSINDRGFKTLPAVSLDPEVNFDSLWNNVKDSGIQARMRKYLYQVNTYFYETGEEGFLLMDNKNNQDYADYKLVCNEEMVLKEYNRLNGLNNYWERQVAPSCSCLSESDKGTFCRHRTEDEVELDELKQFTQEEF